MQAHVRHEPSHRLDIAAALMAEFAERTGLTSHAPPRRYLWTDAFAVENELALAEHTGDRRHLDRALTLIDQVHRVLGHHRSDDSRRGPLGRPGHPTSGGLRIGKTLPERRTGEAFDPDLEWERDGQYFHYATRWMRALAHAARATGRSELHVWACELAVVQHRAFAYGPVGSRAMYWKTSIDLSRPLVRSMGQHDALDGFVTCSMLAQDRSVLAPSLTEVIADLGSMIDPSMLVSDDPLAIGELLVDGAELVAMPTRPVRSPVTVLEVLEAAVAGLTSYVTSDALVAPARQRTAFRELGLAIGLYRSRSIGRPAGPEERARRVMDALARHRAFAGAIERFWLSPARRTAIARSPHRDLDEVMLASSILASL